MARSSQNATQGQKRSGIMPERPPTSRSTFRKGTQKEGLSCKHLERVFEALPDSILVCDREGKIIRINAATVKLFEVTSSTSWKGKSREQFLQYYQPSELWPQPAPLEPWLMNLFGDNEAGSASPGQTLMLSLSSGQKVYVNYWYVPFFDTEMHELGTVSVFHNVTHRYQKALHLQRVYEAISALTDTIAHLPSHIDLSSSREIPLLSPPVIFVAQQLVDVIRQVLESRRASLFAFGPSGHGYYVAGNGWTPEQEQYHQNIRGRLFPTEFLDETVLACLSTHQEVILTEATLRRLLPFHEADSPEYFLLIPLFLEQQLVGVLCIEKAVAEGGYTPEEIELVKAVAAQTMLIVECLGHLYQQVEAQIRALVQYEIHRLSDNFLTLASHELFTPLTAIYGNIQLAQRRLETLKRYVVEQSNRVHEGIEQTQQSLASASQGASLQKGMIDDLIDDAQIQTNQFKLHLSHYDLLTLLKDAVSKQQRSVPENRVVLNVPSTEQSVPIFADAERITRVFNTYLVYSLSHSPPEVPVIVQLVIADNRALVSVSDGGPGISKDEQEHLWERFSRAKGSAVQHELDLSLGLGFYLCRVIIEHHHGHVGVQSDPGKGETFWFTLPVVACPKQ